MLNATYIVFYVHSDDLDVTSSTPRVPTTPPVSTLTTHQIITRLNPLVRAQLCYDKGGEEQCKLKKDQCSTIEAIIECTKTCGFCTGILFSIG